MPRNALICLAVILALPNGCALSDRSDPRLGVLFGLQQLRYTLPVEIEERWLRAFVEANRPPIAENGGEPLDCDRYAADPNDPERVAPGLSLENMRPRLAVRVCAAAYRLNPSEFRFQYQLARGYLAAGNDTAALPMLQSAAVAGYMRAQVALADVYLRQGQRLGLNTEPGVRWLEKAAGNGSVDSMARLGLIFLQGSATERDAEKGTAWLERAAEAGHPVAMRALGKVLLRGAPVGENLNGDLAKAFALFEKAAEIGDGEGQHMLAMMHGAGHGTERNRYRYVEWIAAAAKNGHPAAQAKLGAEYLGFDDLLEDYPQAYFWTSLAVRNGILEVRSILDFLAERMPPAELREIDRIAARWTLGSPLPRTWGEQELAFSAIPAYEIDDHRSGGEPIPAAVKEAANKPPWATAASTPRRSSQRNAAAATDSNAQTTPRPGETEPAPSMREAIPTDPVVATQPSPITSTELRDTPKDPTLFSDVEFPEAAPAR